MRKLIWMSCIAVAFSGCAAADEDHHHEELTPRPVGHRAFPRLLHSRRAEDLRKGCRPAAFLLVRRGGKDFSRRRKTRPEVRHGILGRGHEPVASALGPARPPPPSSAAAAELKQADKAQATNRARARLYPCLAGVLFQQRQDGSRSARSGLFRRHAEGLSEVSRRPRSGRLLCALAAGFRAR